jgi:hypothetical protein
MMLLLVCCYVLVVGVLLMFFRVNKLHVVGRREGEAMAAVSPGRLLTGRFAGDAAGHGERRQPRSPVAVTTAVTTARSRSWRRPPRRQNRPAGVTTY